MVRQNLQEPGAEVHTCPFDGCTAGYLNKSNLKLHLLKIRGGKNYNDVHREDDPLWNEIDERGLLKQYPRPGDLTEEQKLVRRSQTQARSYDKHKDKIKLKSKERRNKTKKTLVAAGELGKYMKTAKDTQSSAITTFKSHRNILQVLYGSSEKYDLPQFMCDDDDGDNVPPLSAYPASFMAFARIVVFYLPSDDIPDATNIQYGVNTFGDMLPNRTHQKAAISQIHPDKSKGNNEIAALFNASWDLWKVYLDDVELMSELVPGGDSDEATRFEERGDKYKAVADMFWSYVAATNRSVSTLCPSSLCLNRLTEALKSLEITNGALSTAENLVCDGKVDELLGIVDECEQPTRRKKRKQRRESGSTEDTGEMSEDGGDSGIMNENIDPLLTVLRPTPRRAAAMAAAAVAKATAK
jgi:hypothetical protein